MKSSRSRVAISGLPFFVESFFSEAQPGAAPWERYVLRFGNRFDWFASIVALIRADVWYTIGSVWSGRAFEWIAALLRKPRVVHWVGSDIAFAREHPRLLDRLRRPNVIHLAEADWTACELRELGVDARIAPLPPVRMADSLPPLPDRFTVLLYVPATRRGFYGAAECERLIEAFAAEPVRFLVVGGGQLQIDSPQVENLGWSANLHEVYARSTVLVRLTERDGLSLMVLEALSFGRWVVWPHDFPFVTNAKAFSEVRDALRALLAAHLADTLRLRLDAASYVRESFDRARCLDRIASLWNASLPDRKAETHAALS